MTTWVNPLSSQTDPDAPLLSELGKRWDNNVIAFIEQDSTSPVNAAAYHPYNKVTVGDSNDGLIWDYSVDGASSSIQTPDFEPGYRYLLEWSNLGRVSSFTLSTSAYNASDALIQTIAGATISGGNYYTASRNFVADNYWRGASSTLSFVSDAAVKYVRLTATSPITTGKVYLRRRRDLL